MDLTVWQYVVVFVVIMFAGLVDAIAGGGGLLTIPLYLALGVPDQLILGTNKCVSSCGTLIAVGRYVAHGNIQWRLLAVGLLAAFLAAMGGAALSQNLDSKAMAALLLVIVPLVFVGGRQVPRHLPDRLGPWRWQDLLAMFLIGLVIGGYDGFFGPGTGTFLLLAMVLLLRLAFAQASSHGRLVNFASNLGALAYFGGMSQILWQVAGVAIAGSVLGNWLGSGLVLRRQAAVVRPVFFGVLALLLVKVIWDFMSGDSF